MSYSNPMHRDPRSVAPYVRFDAHAYARRRAQAEGVPWSVVHVPGSGSGNRQDRWHALPDRSQRLEFCLRVGGRVVYRVGADGMDLPVEVDDGGEAQS